MTRLLLRFALLSSFVLSLGFPAFSAGDVADLTPREVVIDGLGADPQTAWRVHIEEVEVLDGPTSGAAVVVALPLNSFVTGSYHVIEETDEEWLRVTSDDAAGWIPRSALHRVHPRNAAMIESEGNLPFGREIVNRWWGIPLDYEADDLVALPAEYARESDRRTYELRKEAAEAAVRMMKEARAEGVMFYASSPYRSGETQQRIYLRNVSRKGLKQRSSAPPGHSEHQLGTTVDFASAETKRFLTRGCPEHVWLTENGARFGFRQTYREDSVDVTGYIEEPWHWRYLGSVKSGE